MRRAAFTLTEILVSLMIFMVVSGAMLTIMLLATRIYEEAEFGKAANDEAMAVLGMLDRDLARAISPSAGGHFYAAVLSIPSNDAAQPSTTSGDCAVGWTIRNDDLASPDRTRFVFWRTFKYQRPRTLSSGQTIVEDRFILCRGTYEDKSAAPRGSYDSDDLYDAGTGNLSLPAGMAIITDGCIHFGVWLVGTSHNLADTILRSTHPEPERYWTRVVVRNDINAWAEPIKAEPYDTEMRHSDPDQTPLAYPSTIRFTIVLTGGHKNAPVGRLRTALNDTDDTGEVDIRVQGTRGVSTLPGSIMRIGDEIIGYYDFRNGEIKVNSDEQHGPLNAYGNSGNSNGNGRGILRSRLQAHEVGAPVYFGRPYSLVKSLTR